MIRHTHTTSMLSFHTPTTLDGVSISFPSVVQQLRGCNLPPIQRDASKKSSPTCGRKRLLMKRVDSKGVFVLHAAACWSRLQPQRLWREAEQALPLIVRLHLRLFEGKKKGQRPRNKMPLNAVSMTPSWRWMHTWRRIHPTQKVGCWFFSPVQTDLEGLFEDFNEMIDAPSLKKSKNKMGKQTWKKERNWLGVKVSGWMQMYHFYVAVVETKLQVSAAETPNGQKWDSHGQSSISAILTEARELSRLHCNCPSFFLFLLYFFDSWQWQHFTCFHRQLQFSNSVCGNSW